MGVRAPHAGSFSTESGASCAMIGSPVSQIPSLFPIEGDVRQQRQGRRFRPPEGPATDEGAATLRAVYNSTNCPVGHWTSVVAAVTACA